jgi:hypothetical protein
MTALQIADLKNKVMYSCNDHGVCQGRTPPCIDCDWDKKSSPPHATRPTEPLRNRWLPGVAVAVEGPFGPSRAQWLQNLLHMACDLASACAVVGFTLGVAYGVCKVYGL